MLGRDIACPSREELLPALWPVWSRIWQKQTPSSISRLSPIMAAATKQTLETLPPGVGEFASLATLLWKLVSSYWSVHQLMSRSAKDLPNDTSTPRQPVARQVTKLNYLSSIIRHKIAILCTGHFYVSLCPCAEQKTWPPLARGITSTPYTRTQLNRGRGSAVDWAGGVLGFFQRKQVLFTLHPWRAVDLVA